MRCQFEAYHDDMYPEFAPEPIVIRCEAQSTHHMVTVEDAADDGGYPKRGVREVVHTWLCTDHAVEYEPESYFNAMFNSRWLRTTISPTTQEGTDQCNPKR